MFRRESIRHLIAGIAILLVMVGCRQQMADQPSYKPLQSSNFFGDGQSARPLVPDTVSRNDPPADDPLYTGKQNGTELTDFPMTVTMDVLARGQERYNIFCAVCHDRAGTGDGIVVQRGYSRPPSFHIDRLRTAPVGHIFDVITNGLGNMPSYSNQVPAADRWAIIAYIRALQLSQHATISAVPSDQLKNLPGASQ